MINDKKEKILIYSAITLVIVLIISLIIIIWSSSLSKVQYSDINKYSDMSYENISTNYYTEYLEKNLRPSNFDILYENISSEYMSNINCKTKEEMKTYLINNHLISNDLSIIEVSYTENDKYNYYRVTYKTFGQIKYVNIKENKQFNYEISFEQNNINRLINKDSISELYNNEILFEIEMINADSNSVKYRITINNNSIHTYKFNFNSILGAQLRYDNNKYANISALALNESETNVIDSESSKTFEFLYSIDFKDQVKIDGFLFTDVKRDNESINIEFDI